MTIKVAVESYPTPPNTVTQIEIYDPTTDQTAITTLQPDERFEYMVFDGERLTVFETKRPHGGV